jgi:hypothetical protein
MVVLQLRNCWVLKYMAGIPVLRWLDAKEDPRHSKPPKTVRSKDLQTSADAFICVCGLWSFQQLAKSIANKLLRTQIPRSERGLSRTLSLLFSQISAPMQQLRIRIHELLRRSKRQICTHLVISIWATNLPNAFCLVKSCRGILWA